MQMAQERHYWIKGAFEKAGGPPFYERTDGWQVTRAPNGNWRLDRPGIPFFAVFNSPSTQPEAVHVAADNVILAFEAAAAKQRDPDA